MLTMGRSDLTRRPLVKRNSLLIRISAAIAATKTSEPFSRPASAGTGVRTFFHPHRRAVLAALLTSVAGAAFFRSSALAQGDPLPSWNDGRAKQSILDFVASVAREGSPNFLPVPQRTATFDNDGTLWVEQPMYTQLAFAFDQVKLLAPQ